MYFDYENNRLEISDKEFEQKQYAREITKNRSKIACVTLKWFDADFPLAFFEWLATLPKLKKLEIYCNGNKSLQPFAVCSKLEYLAIKGGDISLLDKDFWAQAKALRELTICTTPPDDFWCSLSLLPQLTALSIKAPLHPLPDDFAHLQSLQSLQSLQLNYCQLSHFPQVIAQLPQLKTLQLRENFIQTIDVAFDHCPLLEQIDLHHNQLRAFPAGFLALTRLAHLDLAYNHIAELPALISNLSGSLTTLSLHGNKLTALPDTLRRLQRLQFLHISNNQLTHIPDALYHLPALQRLDLEGNTPAFGEALKESTLFFYFPLFINTLRGFPAKIRGKAILDVLRFGRQLAQITPSHAIREQLIAVFFQETDKVSLLPPSIVLAAASTGMPETTVWAIDHLYQRTAIALRSRPLQAGAKLMVMGSWGTDRTHFLETLQSFGIEVFFDVRPEMDYVLICPPDKNKPLYFNTLFDRPDIIFLKEPDIVAFFEQQQTYYLRTDTDLQEDTLEKIRALLYSHTESNIALAFQMMESGGVPHGAIEDLLLFYLSADSLHQPFAAAAAALLKIYASDALRTELLTKYKKNRSSIVKRSSYKELCAELTRMGLNAQYFCEHFLLHAIYRERLQPDFIHQTFMHQTDLSRRNDLILGWLDRYVEQGAFSFEYFYYYALDFALLAPALLSRKDITRLDLVQVKNIYAALAQNIGQMQHIEHLKMERDAGCIPLFHHLPRLQSLEIDYCNDAVGQDCSTAFEDMPALHTLRLKNCPQAVCSAALQVPSLQILEIHFSHQTTLHLSQFRLPEVTEIHFLRADLLLPDDPSCTSLAEQLPKLTTLRLENMQMHVQTRKSYKLFLKRINSLLPHVTVYRY